MVNGVGAKKKPSRGVFGAAGDAIDGLKGAFTGFGTQWCCERGVEQVFRSGGRLPW